MTKYTVTMALAEEGTDGEWSYSTDHAWHTFYEGASLTDAQRIFDHQRTKSPVDQTNQQSKQSNSTRSNND